MVTGEAAAQMHPPPAGGEAVAARRLEVARHLCQWSVIEMGATMHSPAPFFRILRANLARACTRSRPSQPRSPPTAETGLGKQHHDLA
jgi:hypothetical protein